jgi:hypothetical protein
MAYRVGDRYVSTIGDKLAISHMRSTRALHRGFFSRMKTELNK